MLLLGGLVSASEPDPAQLGCGGGPHSPINRASMSMACVDEPGRISTAELIGELLV